MQTLVASAEAPGRGDEVPEALGALFSQHREFVGRCLAHLGVRQDARDDASQDVFVIAFRRAATRRPDIPIRGWLFAICRRVAANERRGRQRHDRKLTLLRSASASSVDDADRALAFAQFLDALDEEHRLSFVLMAIEGLTAREAGIALEISPNTAQSRTRAVRLRLASLLEEGLLR